MEENNTEYTEETTPDGEYIEIEESPSENRSESENIDTPEDVKTESGGDAGSDTNSETIGGDGNENTETSDNLSSSDTENNPDDNSALLDRLDSLIESLSPEIDSETGEVIKKEKDGEEMSAEPSEYDVQLLETLQSVDATLTLMRTESISLHTETLKYREETRKAQENLILHIEFTSLILIAIAFFTALHCGCKYADIFFKRMRGDAHA